MEINNLPLPGIPIGRPKINTAPSYTVGTVVTKSADYLEMRATFAENGFSDENTVFLYADNRQNNEFDAYEAYNRFLTLAKTDYVILCHQDIRLLQDGRAKLDSLIQSISRSHPDWALLGNAGAALDGLVIRISDPYGEDRRIGPALPAKVLSLDENFIVVRKAANLGFSRDLRGFHLYGADICMNATSLGYSAYVVDFHLRHLSGGSKDHSFFQSIGDFSKKFNDLFSQRYVPLPTDEIIYLSGVWRIRRLHRLQKTVSGHAYKLRKRIFKV